MNSTEGLAMSCHGSSTAQQKQTGMNRGRRLMDEAYDWQKLSVAMALPAKPFEQMRPVHRVCSGKADATVQSEATVQRPLWHTGTNGLHMC